VFERDAFDQDERVVQCSGLPGPATTDEGEQVVDLEADLIAYYDAEAVGGHRVEHGPLRHELRRRFVELLRNEERRSLLDVGAGPGLDTQLWSTDGFGAIGVDLAPQNCVLMRSKGLEAVNASLFALPFADASFDASWTMSTFVHAPPERVGAALHELVRVVKPGGPLGIGTWGGRDFAGTTDFGTIRPFRYFSLATHERWRAALEAYGVVELFETFSPNGDLAWQYQYAVLRATP
jgi:ubiquinone/menaquinone biosynthesis C-methylase UbiE